MQENVYGKYKNNDNNIFKKKLKCNLLLLLSIKTLFKWLNQTMIGKIYSS